MAAIRGNLARLWWDETGASLAEYGLLAVFVAVAAFVAVTSFGTGVNGLWEYIAQQITDALP